MDGYQYIYIYCLPPAGVLHSQNTVINVSPTTSHKGGGQRYGFININDMYNNDVGKGRMRFNEAYEVNKGWRSLECPFTS